MRARVCVCVCARARKILPTTAVLPDCFAQLKSWHLIQNVKLFPTPSNILLNTDIDNRPVFYILCAYNCA